MRTQLKLIITAGGGGHFSPALAVINELPKDWDVLFVGRKYAFEGEKTLSLEYTTAQTLKLPFKAVEAARLQRHFSRHFIPSLMRFPSGTWQAYKILKEYKPDGILSFGGYVSVPIVLAAAYLRIPIVIHEQTLQVGLANSVASRFAKKICVSWEQSAKYFPNEKVVVTGNPIKFDKGDAKDFFQHHTIMEKDSKLPIIYITGGSLGAHGINELIQETLEKLLQKFVIIHQTGDAKQYQDFDKLAQKRESFPSDLQNRYILTKFIDPYEVASILKKATLVVSRAGMSTVSELLYFGKPTLFIPLPISQNNEQLENALFFKKQGLGEVFHQGSLTSEKLYEHIVSMITHGDRYTAYAQKAKELIKFDASAQIIAVCENVMI